MVQSFIAFKQAKVVFLVSITMILQLLILTCSLLIGVSCDSCLPINGFEGCACRMNDTREIISLYPLGSNTTFGKPRYISDSEFWLFYELFLDFIPLRASNSSKRHSTGKGYYLHIVKMSFMSF